MNRFLGLIFASALVVLAGCGGSSGSSSGPDTAEPGLLSRVSDTAAFESSIKGGLTQMTNSEVLAAANFAEDASFTGTYTQELNVDEADAVRYDGEHLVIAPRRYSACCFIFDDSLLAPQYMPTPGAIRILETDPENASATLFSEIALDSGVSVQGMYQTGEALVALTAEHYYGNYGPFWADIAVWAPEQLGLRIYDLADAANPELSFEAKIDGVFVESRRIGDTIYLVTRHTPSVEGLHYYVSTAQQLSENEQLLAGVGIDDLMPKIEINGESQLLAQPQDCYVTTADEAGKSPVLTSITAVPIDNPESFTTTCYKESAYGIYVSEQALYLTELRPDAMLQRNVTRIHKFALLGTDIAYRGSGDIDGTVWNGNQSDFRLSEHDGDLRVLASQFDWANDDFVDHFLYVLREEAAGPDLEIVATLPNDTRPQEIGKINEALFGVRFLGDRAYAVTFEQIDPLYVIDLADPEDPFIAGELQVPGVSDFLHPVNEDLLLGLGRDMSGSIKLELFDASNVAQPLSRATQIIGGPGSYSEAIYDRHAFTYQPDVNGVDRFAIPTNIFASNGSYTFLGASLQLFEIQGKQTPALATMNHVGTVQPPSAGESPDWIERSRAYIHDDTIFYVRDEDVWVTFWQTPGVVNGAF